MESSDVISPFISAYVEESDEYDYYKATAFPDGFVYFRYKIEIASSDTVDHPMIVDQISAILECIWSMGFAAVAACDFESELSNQGGYRVDSSSVARIVRFPFTFIDIKNFVIFKVKTLSGVDSIIQTSKVHIIVLVDLLRKAYQERNFRKVFAYTTCIPVVGFLSVAGIVSVIPYSLIPY